MPVVFPKTPKHEGRAEVEHINRSENWYGT